MKVLHVFKDYYPPTRGGIEQHVNEVVHSIPGVEFAVLTSSRTRELSIDDDNGVRVIRTPEFGRPMSTPITPRWSKLLRESGSDLLHFHTPNPFGEMMYLWSRSKVPMVVTYHADIIGRDLLVPLFRPFQNSFFRKAKRVIVTSDKLAETAEPLRKTEARNVIVPFGVDVDLWRSRPPEADDIRESHQGALVVFLGRLAHYKGLDILLRAMKSIDATAVIVGEGPMRRVLEQLSRSLRISSKIVFAGEVGDETRRAYLHAADLFVLPSTTRAEAFGIAMLQAMATGTPVISTEVGTGTSWVNQNQVTGLVVPPGDQAALGGAIKTLLRDERRRLEMGQAAAMRVATHFSRDKMLASIVEVYREVLG